MKIIVTWRQGKRPKESASVPFQNSSFSTDSNARSHSIPLAKTYKSLYQLTSYQVKVIKLNKVVKNKLTITSLISNWKYLAQNIIKHVWYLQYGYNDFSLPETLQVQLLHLGEILHTFHCWFQKSNVGIKKKKS